MERRRKLVLIGGSLFLVALGLLYDNKHGKWNQESPLDYVNSKSSIRISQRYTVNPSEEEVVGETVVYNEFYLVEQWAGTICKFKTCQRKPTKFTIHGLWPQNTTAWPSDNCCGGLKDTKCNFSSSAISPTLNSKLAVTWPDLYGDNTGFWKREWEKHGACSVDEVPQPDYFQKSNDLYNTSGRDFFQILDNAGIKANDSTYRVADIKRAISDSTGLNVIVKCYLNSSTSYLQEIYVCVNQAATAFQSCSTATTDKCKARAVFPKII